VRTVNFLYFDFWGPVIHLILDVARVRVSLYWKPPASDAASDMKVQGNSNYPYYSAQTRTQKSRFTPSTPNSAPAAGATDSVQFGTQLLVALLNAQQGQIDGQPQRLANLAAGEPPLQLKDPYFIGQRPDIAVRIATNAGELDQAALQGQSTATLAANMVGTLGLHGTLSVSDVERALGCDNSTAEPQVIAQIRRGIESNWNAMTDGGGSLSTSQLASAIQKYLLNGAVGG
jgi:hypothetical protein